MIFTYKLILIILDSLERDLISDTSQNTSEDASKKANANGTTSRKNSSKKVKKSEKPENKHNLPSSTIKLTKEEKERLANDVMLMNLESVGLQDLI